MCLFHKKTHCLNYCLAFRQKPLDERKKFSPSDFILSTVVRENIRLKTVMLSWNAAGVTQPHIFLHCTNTTKYYQHAPRSVKLHTARANHVQRYYLLRFIQIGKEPITSRLCINRRPNRPFASNKYFLFPRWCRIYECYVISCAGRKLTPVRKGSGYIV